MTTIGAKRPHDDAEKLVCLIASFIADDPAAAGATDLEIVSEVQDRWPHLRPGEIQRAFDIAAVLKASRASDRRSELQDILERTRLFHGARQAAELAYRYEAHRRA